MTIPAQIELTIYQGATFRAPLKRSGFPYLVREECGQLYKCSGEPAPESDRIHEDYTGCTARAQMRRAIGSTEVIHEMTTENGGIILDGDTLTMYLSNTQTEAFNYGTVAPAWTKCVAQVEVVRPDGDVERHYNVTFYLDREGTR